MQSVTTTLNANVAVTATPRRPVVPLQTSNNNALSALFLEGPHDPPEDACGARGASAAMAWGGEAKTGPEAAPVITQLKSSADALLGEKEDTSIAAALGATGGPSRQRVLPLTGMSDPVYAEALVTVHQYDIVMDVSVLNRTAEPMRNVTLELATMGDLKVVEKPPPASLG